MRILVLGGTVFLSEAVAAEALARGHDVVCACRGASGAVPDGARLVRWDRGAGDPAPVEDIGEVGAVVDVARHPSWVRTAVDAFPAAHWVFVSTVNVYADDATPGGSPAVTPLVEPLHEDVDLREDPAAYGRMKVGCEQLVAAGAASSMIVRPGLIVGPGDPTYRFGYWPERLAEPGPRLMGGEPTDVMQVIDVRDLAAWIVTACEQRTSGTYDGVGPAMAVGELLAKVAAGVGSDGELTWAPTTFLTEHDVAPWAGDGGLPLWLPRPDYDGLGSHDVTPSLAAGLVCRPVSDTARDTLAWLRAHPDEPRPSLTREREAELLTLLRPRPGG